MVTKVNQDIPLMAHLMRRAGFGATREELEAYCAKGYEATVEELLHPERVPDLELDLISRYQGDWLYHDNWQSNNIYWTYRMINSKRHLEEKITLFWHGILCASYSKVEENIEMFNYIEMFRRYGLDSFRKLLLKLSREPAMLFFLDNTESHKYAINENYGRELLELFSLGVGMDGHPNYTEDDVKVCAQALTGWTRQNPIPRVPYGGYGWEFKYDPADHNDDEKTFLGEKGRFNGEEVIDIIVKQPACARFVSRHLYNFFVADEPQMPAWQDTPPRDPAAIKMLEDEYFRSNYDIRSMLRVLFNFNFFKNARFTRLKSPAELVIGVARLVEGFKEPTQESVGLHHDMANMGMQLQDPPTVEGWHTGQEWINSGALVERINFASGLLGNTDLPGVRAMVDRLAAQSSLSPEQFVDGCLELLGPVWVSEDTKHILVAEVRRDGELRTTTDEERRAFTRRVAEMLQLITATPEYQLC